MTEKPVIRLAGPKDIDALAFIGERTFCLAVKHLYKPDDLNSFLSDNHSREYYASALADPKVTFWLAEQAGRPVGYCKAGPNSLPCEPPLPDALELSRLYVDPEIQRSGIGSCFIEKVIALAQKNDHPQIVLSVWAENFDGHKLYGRYGFKKFGEYKFKVGDHYDQEFILMKDMSG